MKTWIPMGMMITGLMIMTFGVLFPTNETVEPNIYAPLEEKAQLNPETDLELSCVRMGELYYFRFTDLGAMNYGEVLFPAHDRIYTNADMEIPKRVTITHIRRFRMLAQIPAEYEGLTKGEAFSRCLNNAAPYSGS